MKTLRVALADDEPLARTRLARLLREAGCDVRAELADGPSVLAWLQEPREVDALFLDIQMPGATGLEVAAELGDCRHCPPVVFVTAQPSVWPRPWPGCGRGACAGARLRLPCHRASR